jgi:hypothetical protein
MHDIIVNNIQFILWTVTVLEVVFVVLFSRKYIETKKPIVACMLGICIGLVTDAFLIALGGVVGEIPVWIARIRFICHGALIPLIFPICGYGLKVSQTAIKILWGATLVMIALGILHAFFLPLVPVSVGDSLRHTSSGMAPMWAKAVSSALSFGTVIPLIFSGAVVFARFKTPQLFLSGIWMFVFAAICPATGNMDILFVVSMFGELLMVSFFYWYLVADDRKEAVARKAA